MRRLFASMVLVGALLGVSGPAVADDRCDPAVQAERERVFAELAERGIRIAGITGAGGIAEFGSRADAQRFACPETASFARIAGESSAGGLSMR